VFVSEGSERVKTATLSFKLYHQTAQPSGLRDGGSRSRLPPGWGRTQPFPHLARWRYAPHSHQIELSESRSLRAMLSVQGVKDKRPPPGSASDMGLG
jgi:hypothetical protein